jgi:hypothetical protein
MRRLALLLPLVLGAACTSSDSADPLARTFEFGPYDLTAGQELNDDCIQITLDNDAPIYVSSFELTTGPGFHHSNWFYVPEFVFDGPDGTFSCNERDFDPAIAAFKGGVLFAQSTQSPHEIQAFPPGVVVKIPAKQKIVAQLHLLNATDDALTIHPSFEMGLTAEADVATQLAGISFEDQALGLPPAMRSKFSVECDLDPTSEQIFHRAPDFHIYYALAHYHSLGTGMLVEAVKPDETAATIFSTSNHVGDALGAPIDPTFDMAGYTKIRFTCEYDNPRADTVRWGVGDQEMCVFLAFSDSTYNWGGGVTSEDDPGAGVDDNGVMSFTHGCAVYANDAER